jgi:hypothetical protein
LIHKESARRDGRFFETLCIGEDVFHEKWTSANLVHYLIPARGDTIRGHMSCRPIGSLRRFLSQRFVSLSWWRWSLPAAASIFVFACVQSHPASDMGDPGFPFGPSTVGVQPLAYVQDVKPIFDRDCLSCHGVRESAGGYSVRTYENVMNGQRPGDASSSVVVDCSPGGSMYRYFSGNAVNDATVVFRWMVYYNAAQSR